MLAVLELSLQVGNPLGQLHHQILHRVELLHHATLRLLHRLDVLGKLLEVLLQLLLSLDFAGAGEAVLLRHCRGRTRIGERTAVFAGAR